MFVTIIVQKGLYISFGWCEGKCIKSILIVGNKKNETFCRVMKESNVLLHYINA